MKYSALVILFVVASCTSGINLEPIDYTDLFTDTNSKMWLVNKVVIDDANVAPHNDLDKDVFIFHSNGNCDYIPMKDIGRKPPRKGYFLVDSKKQLMTVEFEDTLKWILGFGYLSEDSILMKPKANSDIAIGIQLKPFPEL